MIERSEALVAKVHARPPLSPLPSLLLRAVLGSDDRGPCGSTRIPETFKMSGFGVTSEYNENTHRRVRLFVDVVQP